MPDLPSLTRIKGILYPAYVRTSPISFALNDIATNVNDIVDLEFLFADLEFLFAERAVLQCRPVSVLQGRHL